MVDASEYTFDILKIFIGNYSPLTYVEILVRVLIIMSYTMVMIKWMGKRAVGSLGSADVLLIVALGSAVGDAMLYPTIPLSITILIITAIASLHKLFVYLGVKNESIRKKTHPPIIKRVKNGELLNENFTKDQVDRNEVLIMLRQHGIKFLSEVEHAYFEQSGKLSVFKFENPE